ncbi:hypothetical protein MMC30_008095 [Trapelia coarctata]|nr:hypothetical protein [Trapelia coarctata]
MFLATFGDPDPSFTGVPHRNAVCKHRILDGPTLPGPPSPAWPAHAVWGDRVPLSATEATTYGSPFCGERADCFIVSLRFLHHEAPALTPGTRYAAPAESTRRTGCNELYSALGFGERTAPCAHPPCDPRDKVEMTLPTGCAVLAGYADQGTRSVDASVYVCRTAGSKAAWWRALIAAAQPMLGEGGAFVPIMVRGESCCFECAITQTLGKGGVWVLVL